MQLLSPQHDFDDGPDLQLVGEKPDRLASNCRDVAAVTGGALITAGVWSIHVPAALIVAGGLILIGAIVGVALTRGRCDVSLSAIRRGTL